jgi:hypothetical protein
MYKVTSWAVRVTFVPLISCEVPDVFVRFVTKLMKVFQLPDFAADPAILSRVVTR